MNSSPFASAIRDITRTGELTEVWSYLAVDDIVARYKRTLLGPLWNAAYMLGTSVALGFVFGAIFSQPLQVILPYILAGFIAWNLGPGMILESANLLSISAGAIKSSSLPYFFYIMRAMARTVLMLAHNIAVFVVVLLVLRLTPFVHWSLLPAVVISVVATLPYAMIMALLCVRFRDVQMFVNSFSQILFLMTPIMWKANQLSGPKGLIVKFNPLYYFVDVVRAPLLNQAAALQTWLVILCIAFVGWAICFGVLVAVRRRIAFWV